MKQALQLKVGQSLTMTPQLQQAIKLLQMSSIDLQQEITRALEENPLLEREDEIEPVSDSSENSIPEQENPVDSIEEVLKIALIQIPNSVIDPETDSNEVNEKENADVNIIPQADATESPRNYDTWS